MPFEGEVQTRWLVHSGEDRKMELLAPFAFIDSADVRWKAETGDTIDGASIPAAIWSKLIGTPFIGDYRRASVVHDVACTKKLRTSKEAHRMFYEAMLADGTDKSRAKMFYLAVRLFGPRWGSTKMGLLTAAAQEPSFEAIEAAVDQILGE